MKLSTVGILVAVLALVGMAGIAVALEVGPGSKVAQLIAESH